MNLDIEGTKHEKVVIIVLSYVIGFTAGFICFGVAQSMRIDRNDAPHLIPVVSVATGEAEVVAKSETPVNSVSTDFAVTYTEGKLQVKNGDKIYLLSIKSSGLDSAVQSAFENQGSHVDIPAYIVSPGNTFVYFCEQQGAKDSCNSLVFDVVRNVIEFVTVDGKKLITTAAVAKTASWSEKGLGIDGKTSAVVTAPAALLSN